MHLTSTCCGEGKALSGVLINLSPWLKEETHKTTAGVATQVSGRHWARRGSLCVGAAELFILRNDGNEGMQAIVVWCYHPLCSEKEDSIGHKVALGVDKVKVWGQIWGLL